MPKGDKTGPLGQGPRTGREMGYCAGHSIPGYMNPCFGRGFRRFGRGCQFGWRGFPITPTQPQAYQLTKEQEIQMLEDESKAIEQEQETLKQELENIRKRIAELKKQE